MNFAKPFINSRPPPRIPRSEAAPRIFLPGGLAMKCEQIAKLLPDYLQESLRPEQNKIVEQHLAACADCTEVVALWKKLATLPGEQPSPAAREPPQPRRARALRRHAPRLAKRPRRKSRHRKASLARQHLQLAALS